MSRIFGVGQDEGKGLGRRRGEHTEPAEGEPIASKALENPAHGLQDSNPTPLYGGAVGFEKDKKHFIYDSETNRIGDSSFQTPTAIPEQRFCVGYFLCSSVGLRSGAGSKEEGLELNKLQDKAAPLLKEEASRCRKQKDKEIGAQIKRFVTGVSQG